MTAALALPHVTSRRVSHGVGDDRGATSTAAAWWGATDWVEVEVRDALDENRDVCRDHHVDPDTVLAVARGHAHFADYRTGRDCRPTNAKLVELLRVSLSTVQRARRVLEQLGLVRRLVEGRSIMTRSERLDAWRRGSSHRQIAAVFALCSRRARGAKTRAPKVGCALTSGRARPRIVEGDTPPGAARGESASHLRSTRLRATTEQRGGRSAPAHTERSDERKPGRLDPATRRLAEGVRFRLTWLRGVSVRRLAPPLSRFAREGWTAKDVERATSQVMTARGWRVIPAKLTQPAAYLAGLLRDVDPAERPGAADEQEAAARRAQRAYERQLVTGTPCEHGQPAGDVPSPRGHLACPECRAAAVDWP